MMRGATIVTGGSTGIGEAICRALLDGGQHVISMARRPGTIEHRNFESVQVDLADRAATQAAAAAIVARHQVLNIVHNAGIIRPALLPDVSLADLDYLTDLHLAATIALTQAVLPSMREAQYGRIVLVSSRAALGAPTRTVYSATKAAMIGMARSWALELAPAGITVNVVAPGPVETDMFHDVIPRGSPKAEQLARSIPVGRIGRPSDVARAVMFFASPDADFITGQSLYVCGGASIGSLAL
jgi:3-oxoacyl-[acyl-carrier protein] reductase